MGKVIAYVRSSTEKQDIDNQRLQLFDYAHRNNIQIDELIEVVISSRKTTKERKIDELMSMLKEEDTLLIAELSRLGRSTIGTLELVNELFKRKIKLISIREGLNLSEHNINSKLIVGIFALVSEIDRDIISLRTKNALAVKKAQGIKLGKPKGTIQKSKFDEHSLKIKELLDMGLSVRKICRYLNFKNHISLNNYVVKKGLRNKLTSIDNK